MRKVAVFFFHSPVNRVVKRLLLSFLISIRSNLTQHCQIVTICWTTVLYHSSRLPRKTGVCSISYHCCRIECFAQLVPSLRELNIPFCLLNSGKLHPMTYLSRKCEVFTRVVYPLTPCHSAASGHSRRPSRVGTTGPWWLCYIHVNHLAACIINPGMDQFTCGPWGIFLIVLYKWCKHLHSTNHQLGLVVC